MQIQAGGGSSFLIRNAATLAWSGIGIGAVVLLIILIFITERRRKQR
ncbi:hypothetical protein PUG42_23840 [Erwiniaceae bacterium L1_54_3]|jgi:hypothetical protein|nr:hypothetical protein [Pantoea formicae]MDF7651576.1 hypothetical protein [Erwiniaceae bacterium L1_54_3]